MQYNSQIMPIWYLQQSASQKFVIDKFQKMEYQGRRGTFTGFALEYASRAFFTEKRGDRDNVNDMVVVLTDGKAQDNPIRSAQVSHVTLEICAVWNIELRN